MRGFRSTFVLLVVLAGLLGYIYFYMKPAAPESEPAKPKVFTVAADKLEEIQIAGSKGETSTIKKIDTRWQLVSPIQAAVDEMEASGITTNLAALENQRIIEENAADLKQYGLDPPRVQVSFRSAGEKAFTRLLIGDKTATGADMYARVPTDRKVFLVSAFLETTFDRTAFDLRDKAVLTFRRDQVQQVDVTGPAESVTLRKDGDRWQLTRPIAARADTTVVEALVGRVQSGQMKSIEADAAAAADLKTYGLDKPELTVALGVGSAVASLVIGKPTPEGTTHYARDPSRPLVFTVDKTLVDDLRKKAADYRMKEVFEFRPYMVGRLEVTRNGATTVFERKKDKDGKDTWAVAAPARNVDVTKMDAALSALAALLATEYVDDNVKTGVESPALVVAATYDDGKKTERVSFGRVGADVFAKRPGEVGTARVEAAKFDEALTALDAVK